MLKDLAGTADLQHALTRTNELLAQVLAELKETNGVRLEAIAAELRSQTQTLTKTQAQGQTQNGSPEPAEAR